jgi:hypothetical protein
MEENLTAKYTLQKQVFIEEKTEIDEKLRRIIPIN